MGRYKNFDELLFNIASGDGSPEAYMITKGLGPKVKNWLTKWFDALPYETNENSLSKLQRVVDYFDGDNFKSDDDIEYLGKALGSQGWSPSDRRSILANFDDEEQMPLNGPKHRALREYWGEDEPEEEDYSVDSPTGIANPSDYMSIVQEDTDGDGDIDKVSVEEKNKED